MRPSDRIVVPAPEVTMRIPGAWARPEEFYESLPGGCRPMKGGIVLADGSEFESGGAGVFVDNSGIAHGATDWHKLLDSADDGGVYWAFITAVRFDESIYSMGMHILGFRDAIIPSTGDAEFDSRTLHSFLGYTAFSGATLRDGEVVGDTTLPTFQVRAQDDDRVPAGAPMFNPFGRWRLERIHVERN